MKHQNKLVLFQGGNSGTDGKTQCGVIADWLRAGGKWLSGGEGLPDWPRCPWIALASSRPQRSPNGNDTRQNSLKHWPSKWKAHALTHGVHTITGHSTVIINTLIHSHTQIDSHLIPPSPHQSYSHIHARALVHTHYSFTVCSVWFTNGEWEMFSLCLHIAPVFL